MIIRTRAVFLAAVSALTVGALAAPAAQANALSLLPGSCGNEMSLLVSNLISTLSPNRTVIAFRFTPADGSGAWSIDDVYLDPFGRG